MSVSAAPNIGDGDGRVSPHGRVPPPPLGVAVAEGESQPGFDNHQDPIAQDKA